MRTRAWVVPVLVASVAAQEAEWFRFVPKDAVTVAWLQGPARLGQQLGDTRVVQFLRDPGLSGALAQFWESVQAGVEDDARRARARSSLEQLLRVVRSSAQVSVGVARDTQGGWFGAMRARSLEPAWFAALDELPAEQWPHAGHEFRLVRVSQPEAPLLPEFSCTLPIEIDGATVVFAGTDLQHQIPRMLALQEAERFVPPPRVAGAAVWLHGDPRPWLEELLRALPAAPEERAIAEQIFRVLGSDAASGCSFAMRRAGEFLTFDLHVALQPGKTGLLDLLLPGTRPMQPWLELIPPQSLGFDHYTFRFGRVRALAERVLEVLPAEVVPPFAELEQQFVERFGADLHEDLLRWLGDDVVLVTDPADVDFDAIAEDVPGGMTVFVTLRDAAGFAAGLDKLIRGLGLHATRKRESYGEHQIVRILVLGFPVHFAITERALVVTVGGATNALRLVLDEVARRKRGEPVTPLPVEVTERIDAAPFEASSLGVRAMAAEFAWLAKEGARLAPALAARAAREGKDDGPDPETIFENMQLLGGRLEALLRKHHVTHQVTLSRSAADEWRMIGIW